MIFNHQELSYNLNPSKSYLHRYLIVASFLNTNLKIKNFVLNNDILETINVLNKIGKKIIINKDYLLVIGNNDKSVVDQVEINESGTTLRLLLPLLANIGVKEIKVGARLFNRPIDEYSEFIRKKDNYTLVLKEGKINTIDASISSQFVSGLLIYNALVQQEKIIQTKNKKVSKNYIEITIDVLKHFGYKYAIDGDIYILNINKKMINEITIENDYSTFANYFIHALLTNKHCFTGYNLNSLQGDKKILDIFKDNLSLENDIICITNQKLKPLNIELDNIIDLAPILFVYASFVEEESYFYEFKRLKDKESNRLDSMLQNFDILGVDYTLSESCLMIKGKKEYPFRSVKSYNDHRIAMAFIVFGLINKNGIDIDEVKCLNKSVINFI